MTIPHRGGLPHSDIHGSKPARGSPWLFAACHVLHRLLVPRHPPNALLSLKIAVPALVPGIHHAQKPSSVISDQCSVIQPSGTTGPDTNAEPKNDPARIISLSTQQSSPLNTLPRPREDPSPTSTLARGRPHPVRLATAARPETHQNLIYTDKDHAPDSPVDSQQARQRHHRSSTEQPVETTCPATIPATPNLVLLRDTPSSRAGRHPITSTPSPKPRELVEVIGLEPTTPCLQSRCSPS